MLINAPDTSTSMMYARVYVVCINTFLAVRLTLVTIGVFSASELNNMVEESLKMSKFNHPNVMRLVGVSIDGGESPYIVMPFMTHGSLLSYLRKHRAELTIGNDDNMELVKSYICVHVLNPPLQLKLYSDCKLCLQCSYVNHNVVFSGQYSSEATAVNVSTDCQGNVILGK